MTNYTLNYDFESINFKLNNYKNIFVFTGGISPKPSMAYKFLKTLGEPDFIIAADSGLESLDLFNLKLKKNYTPNVICGDMDSIKNIKLVKKYSARDLLEFPVYKDFTDTELALMLAKKARIKSSARTQKKSTVTLIGGGGRRIDHLLGIYELFSSNIAPDFWLTDYQLLTFLPQNRSVSVLTKNKRDPVSVLRTTTSNVGGKIVSKGLEWEGNLFRKKGFPSLSNEISKEYSDKKNPAKIEAKEGDFVVATLYSAEIHVD